MTQVYLDYNASTPLLPEVIDAMTPWLRSGYGNPSSGHWAGAPARTAIDAARAQIAGLLGAAPDEVVLTSGGSESNNWAIKGAVQAAMRAGNRQPHVVCSAVEHPSVLEPCAYVKALGGSVTVVRVDGAGRVDPADVACALGPRTVLVSLMHANNEIGTIQPVAEVAALARKRGVLVHCDAAQSVGKIPVTMAELGVDLLTVAGHKLYAPKGVGALLVRRGVALERLIHGASHEGGRRAGTENVMSVVGLGAACALAAARPCSEPLARLRDYLWQCLETTFGARITQNGHPSERLPNTLNVSFTGADAAALLEQIPALAASTGSACHAGSRKPSPVLTAMGASEAVALGAVRFSVGRPTTRAELDRAVALLSQVC